MAEIEQQQVVIVQSWGEGLDETGVTNEPSKQFDENLPGEAAQSNHTLAFSSNALNECF